MSFAAIDVGQLFELVWAAALAAVVVATAFSLALVGFTRAAEKRRDRSGGAATGYAILGFAGSAAFLGAVVFGITVIVNK